MATTRANVFREEKHFYDGTNYRQTSYTLLSNKHVDHSDVVAASPVGAAPTTSSLSTYHLASMIGQIQLQGERGIV